MRSGKLFIRADASASLGTGHAMRCLALAQAAMARGMKARLMGRIHVPWLAGRLASEAMEVQTLPGFVPRTEKREVLLRQLAGVDAGAWVVLDGYHFDLACHKAVREAGYKLLVIDDCAHLPEYFCDILLNQNIDVEELAYRGDIGQRLLGPEYALLRTEFRVARQKSGARRCSEKVRNILLTLGGGDCSEHLARIAPDFSLPELAGRTVRVIAGAMPRGRIRELFHSCPARLEVLGGVDDMPALLLDTDLCVSAGGSTCWELCCLGVPFLTLEAAENQHGIVHGLHARNIASIYSREAFAALLREHAARRGHADAGAALVDGLGAERVVRIMAG